MNRLYILVLIQFIITIASTKCIINFIEKHSVHPVYGNYKKVSSDGMTCEPWDDCR